MPNIIEVRNLRKCYKSVEALKGIDFSVKEGSFFAFLGENGAGKSTAINIISTLLKKTSGDIIINNHQVDYEDHKIREDIGIVFQGNMLDKFLTVRENIIQRGVLYGLSKNEINNRMYELAETIGVADFLDRRYGKLSGGQKRRADIIRALINKPKVLILDEPTTGLDPYTRKSVWEIIKQLNEECNLTIFLTTHYMEETAGADYIVIMDSGEIKAVGNPEQLKSKYSSDRLILSSKDAGHITKLIKEMNYNYGIDREHIIIRLENTFDAIKIIEKLRNEIESFEVIRGSMDDVFINVIGSKSQNMEMSINE